MRAVDLVVAGGGPAGLAAAIEAAHAGMSVVVLDPHPGTADKACGEGILPRGVAALGELGVEVGGRPFLGVRYADAFDPDLRALGHFPSGVGLGVRRTALHGAMREAALASGVELRVERLTSFTRDPDGVVVNGELAAGWLVAADGLRSRIRRALGVARLPHGPRRFGLRRHYAVTPWADRVEVYFGGIAEAYVTPVGERLVGVALLFEGRAREERLASRFDRLLAGFPLLVSRLEGAPSASKVRGAGPFEQRVAQRVVDRVLLVGDAAGYVDPLTGEGIAVGIATARAAIRCVLRGDPEGYEREWERLTRRPFALTSALLGLTRRRALCSPMLRIVRARPAVFDAALGMIGGA